MWILVHIFSVGMSKNRYVGGIERFGFHNPDCLKMFTHLVGRYLLKEGSDAGLETENELNTLGSPLLGAVEF